MCRLAETIAAILTRDVPVTTAAVASDENNDDKPWKTDADYFRLVEVLPLALSKMTLHATLGGDLEVMGMMLGSVRGRTFVVLDVYALPVEGTETRVNAHEQSYEYMIQYLQSYQQAGRQQHIVGWYHLHPGYRCWLSGIDVATQRLQQLFLDPFLAVVVDPHHTASTGFVDIGAFRTYTPQHVASGRVARTLTQAARVPMAKAQDYGAHADDYYALQVVVTMLDHAAAAVQACVGETSLVVPEGLAEAGELAALATSITGYAKTVPKYTRPPVDREVLPRPPPAEELQDVLESETDLYVEEPRVKRRTAGTDDVALVVNVAWLLVAHNVRGVGLLEYERGEGLRRLADVLRQSQEALSQVLPA